MSLERLLREAKVWRGNAPVQMATSMPSGVPALDTALGGTCWPVGALVEILSVEGFDGLQLLLPLLVRLSTAQQWLTWVSPPHIPYAPTLASYGIELSKVLVIQNLAGTAEKLWAAEQALRSGACSVVMLWPSRIEFTLLRRLQLAAESGRALGILFRTQNAKQESTPAVLRLSIERKSGHAEVRILKCKGACPSTPIKLPFQSFG